jgi:hypothetical protein
MNAPDVVQVSGVPGPYSNSVYVRQHRSSILVHTISVGVSGPTKCPAGAVFVEILGFLGSYSALWPTHNVMLSLRRYISFLGIPATKVSAPLKRLSIKQRTIFLSRLPQFNND